MLQFDNTLSKLNSITGDGLWKTSEGDFVLSGPSGLMSIYRDSIIENCNVFNIEEVNVIVTGTEADVAKVPNMEKMISSELVLSRELVLENGFLEKLESMKELLKKNKSDFLLSCFESDQ